MEIITRLIMVVVLGVATAAVIHFWIKLRDKLTRACPEILKVEELRIYTKAEERAIVERLVAIGHLDPSVLVDLDLEDQEVTGR